MNKNLRNALIITPVILIGAAVGLTKINKMNAKTNNNDISNETIKDNEKNKTVVNTENTPDTNIEDNSTSNNGINEVLANWNEGQAPMPIPVITDEDRELSDILPVFRESENLWGYACTSNEIIIKHQFANAGAFYSDYAPVQLKEDGQIGFIDKQGKIVKEPFIDYIDGVTREKGIMVVRKGNKYGALNLEGEIMQKIQFYSIDELANELGYKNEEDLFYGDIRESCN